jgi:hypothetical protein
MALLGIIHLTALRRKLTKKTMSYDFTPSKVGCQKVIHALLTVRSR